MPSLQLLALASALQLAGTVSSVERLPDYDCLRSKQPAQRELLPWAEWLHALQNPGPGGWLESSRQYLTLLTTETRLQAQNECPVGLLAADLLRTMTCYSQGNSCYEFYEPLARKGLADLGLRVLMGSRWPVYSMLNSDAWDRPGSGARQEALERRLDCEAFEASEAILDWGRFKAVFDSEDWYQEAVDTAYGPELEKGWRDALPQCPLGFAMANLIKAMLCSHTESICFRAHETMLHGVLLDAPLHLIHASGWPLLRMLGHVARAVKRHGFQLDFLPGELLGAAGTAPQLQGAESTAMKDLSASLPALRKAAERAAASLASEAFKVVYATMAHGARFSPYVSRFIGRARALGIGEQLVVFCLDSEALAECNSVEGNCVRGTPSILNKFTLPLVLLRAGLDVMWLDLDVFLFQSPSRALAQKLRESEAELLISGSFAVDCICSGIVFFRCTQRTVAFLEHLLIWMYEHPYEHDQKAFSAFLRAGERVAFDSELPLATELVPPWDFLDPETQFVSARHVDVAGWTGNADEIVAFHLLHGDSDDAVASRQFAARMGLGVGYTPLLDLFFNQTTLPELYKTPVLPHHISEELREALWRSRWPSRRPASPGRCNETVPMRF